MTTAHLGHDRTAVGGDGRSEVWRPAHRGRLDLRLEHGLPAPVNKDVGDALPPVLAEQRVEDEGHAEEGQLAKVMAARAAHPLGVEQLDDGERVEKIDVIVRDDRLKGGGARADVRGVGGDAFRGAFQTREKRRAG